MKETTEKVYRCEFCNKALIRKGFVVLHERMCKSNPKNKHKCFEYCAHLEKEKNDYSGEFSFVCAKTQKYMYSYKLERFAHKAERIQNDELTRMPLECQLYELSDEHSDYGKQIVEVKCDMSCF